MTAAETVKEAVRQLVLGTPITFENLTIIPLTSSSERDAGYATLDEALAAGHVRITEVDDHGRVPELKVSTMQTSRYSSSMAKNCSEPSRTGW